MTFYASEASPSVGKFALTTPYNLVPRYHYQIIPELHPPVAEWQDGFSIRADGTGGGRNGLREDVDCFPFASTGLTSFCASSVGWLIPSSHGSLALLSVLAVVPFPLPTVFQVPFHFLSEARHFPSYFQSSITSAFM